MNDMKYHQAQFMEYNKSFSLNAAVLTLGNFDNSNATLYT